MIERSMTSFSISYIRLVPAVSSHTAELFYYSNLEKKCPSPKIGQVKPLTPIRSFLYCLD